MKKIKNMYVFITGSLYLGKIKYLACLDKLRVHLSEINSNKCTVDKTIILIRTEQFTLHYRC